MCLMTPRPGLSLKGRAPTVKSRCLIMVCGLTAGLWDTGLWDTGLWDTGLWDTGLWDTGLWDTGLWDIGLWDTGLWEARLAAIMFRMNGISQGAHGCAVRLSPVCTAYLWMCGAIVSVSHNLSVKCDELHLVKKFAARRASYKSLTLLWFFNNLLCRFGNRILGFFGEVCINKARCRI
jgi:hypothetical protein